MPLRIAIAAVVIAVLAALGYYVLRPYLEPPPPPPAAQAQAPAPKPAQPQFPIGAGAKALPKLGESDPALRESLSGLVDAKALGKLFNLEDGIRHIVATVDNLPRETIARRVNPVRPVPGLFVTTGKDETLAIAPKNAARYAPLVGLIEGVDTPKAVAAYVYLYPLFQQAFVELGYPDGHFNDRLVEVIDHLLDAPEPKGPVKLVTPHVLYEYADPDLERLSAGQKMMIRAGAENESRLKVKLKQVRAEVVAAAAKR